jgi:hypothetical protein
LKPLTTPAVAGGSVQRWLEGFGALRLLLLGSAVALVLLAPFSGGRVEFEGVAFVTTLLAPVAFAIYAFLLPLDMAMTAIFMTDALPQRHAALKRALITEAVVFAVLMLAWLPFVLSMLRLR